MAIGVVEGGTVYYVRTDHIGRPVFATDGFGVKVWGGGPGRPDRCPVDSRQARRIRPGPFAAETVPGRFPGRRLPKARCGSRCPRHSTPARRGGRGGSGCAGCMGVPTASLPSHPCAGRHPGGAGREWRDRGRAAGADAGGARCRQAIPRAPRGPRQPDLQGGRVVFGPLRGFACTLLCGVAARSRLFVAIRPGKRA